MLGRTLGFKPSSMDRGDCLKWSLASQENNRVNQRSGLVTAHDALV
jgi:hypothetical protein